MSDLIIKREVNAGCITLNRPDALNALNHRMIGDIHKALAGWVDDDDVSLVIFDSAGGKAFCAGGDIVDLYTNGRTQPERGRSFWADEYRLNAFISHYPKPVVTLLDGIVMGGGVGLGCHASHRIVTERTMIAMPEVLIGFCPDVGGTRLLGKAPGRAGEYLGLTGTRMSGADAVFARFADRFVPSTKLPQLIVDLQQHGDINAIEKFAEPVPQSQLESSMRNIDKHFCEQNPVSISARLSGSPFAEKAAKSLGIACPSAVAAALHAIRAAREDASITQSLAREYRFSYRSLEGQNFYEGIRAAVIDKDRSPKWAPVRLEDVPASYVAEAFASLGVAEWTERVIT